MRKIHPALKPAMTHTTVLALCTALLTTGCASLTEKIGSTPDTTKQEAGDSRDSSDVTEPVNPADPTDPSVSQFPPAYVYYIKNSDLMRADVNAGIEAGKNPSVVMEGAGANTNLKDYYDVLTSEDGTYSIFKFETGTGIFDFDEKLVAVNHEDGKAELVYEGYANPTMWGNKLLLQIEDDSEPLTDTAYDLYSYAPGQGKKLEISGLYNYDPSRDGSAICFTRLAKDGQNGQEQQEDQPRQQNLFLYADNQETLLSSDLLFAGGNADYSVIYGENAVEEDELFYYEITRFENGKPGEPILTKEDHAGSYYLDPGSDGVYYSVYQEGGPNSLYYASDGRKQLLSDQVSMVWEFIQQPYWLEDRSMILYKATVNGHKGLFAAIDGTVSELTIPDITDNWVDDYYLNIAGGNGAVYLAVTRLDDSYQAKDSWIYRYPLTGNQVNPPTEQPVHGAELDLIRDDVAKAEDGKYFYTQYADTQNLYCGDTKILENYYTGTLRQLDGEAGEYFAYKDNGTPIPDLMRLTTAGSSKVFRSDVVQSEPFAGGMLMLSGCREQYPYLGTLSYYNVTETKVIDEDVTVFFQHDADQFTDVVPMEWDWSGQNRIITEH